MSDIISKKIDKKTTFNLIANSEHIMKVVDQKIVVTGIMFSAQAGKECAYIITGDEALFTDGTTLISELRKFGALFENEILSNGVEIIVSQAVSSKGKTVYKITIV